MLSKRRQPHGALRAAGGLSRVMQVLGDYPVDAATGMQTVAIAEGVPAMVES